MRVAGLILQSGDYRLLRVYGGRQLFLGNARVLASFLQENPDEELLIARFVCFGKGRVAILALLNVFIEIVHGSFFS